VEKTPYEFALQHTYLGLNRENFISGILDPIFGSSIRACAEAMELNPNYLRDILNNEDRDAGTKTLSCIYRFCMNRHIDPYPYIFVVK